MYIIHSVLSNDHNYAVISVLSVCLFVGGAVTGSWQTRDPQYDELTLSVSFSSRSLHVDGDAARTRLAAQAVLQEEKRRANIVAVMCSVSVDERQYPAGVSCCDDF